MLLIQDLNVDSSSFATIDMQSDVVWTKEDFLKTGLVSSEDTGTDDELKLIIVAAKVLRDDRNVADAFMHNPAVFQFSLEEGVRYEGNVTDGGNVFIVQTITHDDGDVYQTVGYDGTRGRLVQELEWIKVTLDLQSFSDLIYGNPSYIESNGPADMLVYEDAYVYAIRKYEAGDKDALRYWLDSATSAIMANKTPAFTATSVVRYMRDNSSKFESNWIEFEASVSAAREVQLKLVYAR